MKRLHNSILLCFFASMLFGQEADTAYVKKVILETDFQVLTGYYDQDGQHSAVTGGRGTEKLEVIPLSLYVTENLDTANQLLISGGVDIITSASVDNIDFEVSSASFKDRRIWMTLGYAHDFSKKRITTGAAFGVSFESDYMSFQPALWLDYQSADLTRRIGFKVQGFIDDLRWGRFSPSYKRPVTLVYPVELRGTEWFDNYMRYTVNLDLSFEQDINQRLTLGLFTGFYSQYGLLSTPFHRIFFADSSEGAVEKLPDKRFKVPVGLHMNSFVAGGWILKFYYRYSRDNFGISAHTLGIESPVKVSRQVRIVPFGRFYTQTAATYFSPFAEHLSSQVYYTSDYDLSAFNSYKVGIGVRYIPFKRLWKSTTIFKEVTLRYAFYYRSDGLSAHIITGYLNLGVQREQRQKKNKK